MYDRRKPNRRNVLKTIGAGVLGGTVLAGSATASSERTDIHLRGHNFTPNQANVRLGDGGSATVRWINDEVDYFGEGFPVPHDVHLHGGGGHLVESGIFTQISSFEHPDLPVPVPLGPTFYEVEFREEGDDLVIEEVDGKVASTGFDTFPPIQTVWDPDEVTIEDWGGEVTLDVHCSLHSNALVVDENELVLHEIKSEETEPPYEFHLGFFKMEGGLTITR